MGRALPNNLRLLVACDMRLEQQLSEAMAQVLASYRQDLALITDEAWETLQGAIQEAFALGGSAGERALLLAVIQYLAMVMYRQQGKQAWLNMILGLLEAEPVLNEDTPPAA
jgi:hypothetical protein